jgi:PKD repeat protein
VFTATPTGLSVAVDASGSADLDGIVARYDWNFGDGTSVSETDPFASHTYATEGTRTVALTVTDDDGAQASAAQLLTVVAPPPPPPSSVVAEDGFGRTVSSSWGSADVGGVWARSGTAANFSVAGGVGQMVIPSGGSSRAAWLGSVALVDVDVSVDASLDKVPTGGGSYVGVSARRVGSSEYRLRGYLRTTGSSLQLMRVVSGVETVLGSVALAGGSVAAGQVLHLRLLATGTGPTALSGKAWFGSSAEPAGWLVQATDASAALQVPGAVGVHAYVSSSATNTPVTISTDNLRATMG